MKKKYLQPVVEVACFEENDVIRTSPIETPGDSFTFSFSNNAPSNNLSGLS